VGSTRLAISFDAFDVLPHDVSVDKGPIEVYLVDNPIVGTFIDLKHTKDSSTATWLSFDSQAN
jgi:hypothetical protein